MQEVEGSTPFGSILRLPDHKTSTPRRKSRFAVGEGRGPVASPVFKTALSRLVRDGRFDSFPSPPALAEDEPADGAARADDQARTHTARQQHEPRDYPQ